MPTSSAPPICSVLFDVGNVLLRFDFSIALRRIAALSEIADPVDMLVRLDQMKQPYEDGRIGRDAFVSGAMDALRYRGQAADFVAALEEIFEPNEPMFALVEKLHGRLPLFLLSNTSDIHRKYFFRQYPVFQRFTGGVYSDVVRCSKPSPEIYQIACQQLGLEPATTFFIDDLLPNIEAARALGFVAHHYHHERHADLLAQLATAGVSVD